MRRLKVNHVNIWHAGGFGGGISFKTQDQCVVVRITKDGVLFIEVADEDGYIPTVRFDGAEAEEFMVDALRAILKITRD